MAIKSNAAGRWQACALLARDYGVPAKLIASATGLGLKVCTGRLTREGIDPEGGGMRERIYRTLSEQLRAVQTMLAGGELDKGRLDALTAYIRAVERVLGLLSRDESRDAAPEGQGGLPALNPADLAGVLHRIETRIEELARQRAADLVEEDILRQGGAGGGA